jgi:uncharacterized protein (TIGR02145 family)
LLIIYRNFIYNIEKQHIMKNLYLTFLLGFSLLSQSFAQLNLQDSLVAYYPFNGNANDESGNGNDGTVYGATSTIDRFGNQNNAYLFDGENDYIEIQHSESFNTINKEISISVWAKFETDGPYYYPYHIIEKYPNWAIGQRKRDITWGFVTEEDSIKDYGMWTTINDYEKWIHIVTKYNGSSFSTYVNGNLLNSDTASGLIGTNNSNVYISRYILGGDYYFDGTLDDFRIYNRALTEAEINSLYHEGGWPEIAYISDIDGNLYNTVTIGDQSWMAENLKTTKYNDGTNIPLIANSSNWANLTFGAYCWYGNMEDPYKNIYGAFYNWYAVNTGKLCPTGWHIPSDDEWKTLEQYLGMSQSDIDATGWRGTDQGTKMKNTTGWSGNGNGTNISGFSALPGGGRNGDGSFASIGYLGMWWTATEDTVVGRWYRVINYNQGGLSRAGSSLNGFSVRCVKEFNVAITDSNLRSISELNFCGSNKIETIISNNGLDTMSINSIYNNNQCFKLNYLSAVLIPGDNIHLNITFNPTVEGFYYDTLFIKSNDTYDSLITIPLHGILPSYSPEITITSNTGCSGYSVGTATVIPLTGVSPFYYQWDDPENTTNSTVTNLSSNIFYHVIVIDRYGCTTKDSIILSESEPILIEKEFSSKICPGSNTGFINLNVSGGIPPYSYDWSTGAKTSNINGLGEGEYMVTITDIVGCIVEDATQIDSFSLFQDEKICLVTIDLMSGKNLIVWEKTPNKGTAYYNIYREAKIGQYVLIGSRDAVELSIFKDEKSNPKSQSYLYKITVTDSCGNESNLESTPYHWPSFLQYVSSVGGINLSWTDYRIEGINNIEEYLTSYVIYRATDSTGLSEYQEVGRQLNFTDTDPDALVRRYYYRVAAVLKNPCYPTGSSGKKDEPGPYSLSMSNIEDNRIQVGVKEYLIENTTISVIPNPFNESTTLLFSNPEGYQYKLYIMDLSGKVCRIVDDITTSEYMLEKGDLKQGFYFVELRGPNIYRGKIIIE